MTNLFTQLSQQLSAQPARRLSRWFTAFGVATIVLACGGGSSMVAGVGSGGTGVVVNGPTTGFGSVIVNGIRFDDSAAVVTLDDDVQASSDDLRLGMVTQVEGERESESPTGIAKAISSSSFVQGPIAQIDPAGQQLTVLGLVIMATETTLFDGANGLDDPALAPGALVEVHGIPDQSGQLVATRITRKDAGSVNGLRLSGTVQGLNTQDKTFKLYGFTVRYDTAANVGLANGIVDGMTVRIKGSLSNADTIVATSVHSRNMESFRKEGLRVNLEGIITSLESPRSFEVNGLKVNIVNPLSDVTPTLGARVEVEGTITNGILLVTKLQSRSGAQQALNGIELHGPISELNLLARTFKLRNTMVRWDGTSAFLNGLRPEQLTNDMNVEVRGRIAGSVLIAVTIKRE